MVATTKGEKRTKVLDLFALREIEASCLCLHTEKRHEREYKAVVSVTPINFSLMSEPEQESILESFRIFLARLATQYPVAIHIRIESYDLGPYLHQLESAKESPSEAIREMVEDHEHFVLSLASQRALLKRKFYVIVGADRERGKFLERAEVFDRAKSQLILRTNDIEQDMSRIGLTAHRLDDGELGEYYQSCLHAQHARTFPLIPSNTRNTGRATATRRPLPETSATHPTVRFEPLDLETDVSQTKKKKGKSETHGDLVAGHVNLPELLQPSAIEETHNYVRIHHNGDEYVRGYSIIGYPAIVSSGWLDRLIQIDEPSIEIMMYLEPLNSTAYSSRLGRKVTGLRAVTNIEDRHGRTHDPNVKAALKDNEELREKLTNQTEHVFGVSLYLLVRATSVVGLKERANKLLSLLHSLELSAVEATLEHLKLYQCCLPDARNILQRRKVLETSSIVTAFPFASTTLSTEKGILIGVQNNGSLVVMDPSSDELENGHEIKFARSGAGKSYDEIVRIARSLMVGYRVIVVDPEGEYTNECRQFGGSNIRLSSGALLLSPFYLPSVAETQGRDILEEKFHSLLTVFDLLLGETESDTLPQLEKAYLTRCFERVYADVGITRETATHTLPPPTMRGLYEVICSGVCGADEYQLGVKLQRHVAAFPDATHINLDAQLIVFNIRDLSKELRPVAFYLIIDFVWTQIRRQRVPQKRLLVIDEAWTLLQTEQGGQFLASLARRARKYKLGLRIISQDVEDFVSNEYGRIIIGQAASKHIMRQDETTIDAVTRAFRLSDGERKYLKGCAKGESLYFALGSHVPMKTVASPLEHMLATKAQDDGNGTGETEDDTYESSAFVSITREDRKILPLVKPKTVFTAVVPTTKKHKGTP